VTADAEPSSIGWATKRVATPPSSNPPVDAPAKDVPDRLAPPRTAGADCRREVGRRHVGGEAGGLAEHIDLRVVEEPAVVRQDKRVAPRTECTGGESFGECRYRELEVEDADGLAAGEDRRSEAEHPAVAIRRDVGLGSVDLVLGESHRREERGVADALVGREVVDPGDFATVVAGGLDAIGSDEADLVDGVPLPGVPDGRLHRSSVGRGEVRAASRERLREGDVAAGQTEVARRRGDDLVDRAGLLVRVAGEASVRLRRHLVAHADDDDGAGNEGERRGDRDEHGHGTGAKDTGDTTRTECAAQGHAADGSP
jgi:hypothetical protein